MKAERRKPCPNCPFRKDAKLAYWAPGEYLMIRDLDAKQGNIESQTVFGCHKDRHGPREDQEVCIGWMLYQRANGIPSIALRLKLMREPECAKQYNEAEADGEMYETIDELVETNLRAYMSDLPSKDV